MSEYDDVIMLTSPIKNNSDNNKKNRHLNKIPIEGNSDGTKSPEEPPQKILNCNYTIKIVCAGDDDSFLKINWIEACKFINSISENWELIAFSNDHKNALINGLNNESTEKLLAIKEIVIDNVSLPVIAGLVKPSSRKGIIYNKILINLDDDQFKQAFQNQNIVNIFRIQKTGENQEKCYTGSIIIEFEDVIPDFINFSKIKIPVNHLTPRPMLCFHCGILGHTKARCLKRNTNFCSQCFHNHDINDQCTIICKQCQGPHISSFPSCEFLIKEVQILKLRESLGLNYLEAKSINQAINPIATESPLEASRTRIQVLTQKINSLITIGKQTNHEKFDALRKLEDSLKENVKLKDELKLIKENHNKELEDLGNNFQELYEKQQSSAAEGKELLEKMNNAMTEVARLKDKNIKNEQIINKLVNEKKSDAKTLEEFFSHSEYAVKEFVKFSKKTQLSFQIELKTKRGNSLERKNNT